MRKIILASASPRRRELLAQIGVEFDVIVSGKEEKIIDGNPEQICMALAKQKAQGVKELLDAQGSRNLPDEQSIKDLPDIQDIRNLPDAQNAQAGETKQDRPEDFTIIGADTIVVLDGKIFGKPADEEHAARMLRALSGRAHQVYTGVCVITDDAIHAFAEKTDVYVTPLSEDDIEAYIATGDPMDKAGAYGIQGIFARHIQKIDGDYFNVVGLPIGRLWREFLSSVF